MNYAKEKGRVGEERRERPKYPSDLSTPSVLIVPGRKSIRERANWERKAKIPESGNFQHE